MTAQLIGFPYWELAFDDRGRPRDPAAHDSALAAIPAEGLTDLIVFSHGWNNDPPLARDFYQRFFTEFRALLDSGAATLRPGRTMGIVGVLWPSLAWPDETPQATSPAASLVAPPTDQELVLGLRAVFTRPKERKALRELATLLEQRPRDPQALARFQQLMKALVRPGVAGADEDNGEHGLVTTDPQELFARFTDSAEARRPGGAAGLGDAFSRLWDGAKAALRAATYWQMKGRAGVVGQTGLGPWLGRLHDAQDGLRLHLFGHSFGARLVSFALAGLPASAVAARPVKTVFLLQGAFSHFAFATALPQDPDRGGALAGMQARVDGPLLVSHSRFDTAVGEAYPLASILARDDAAGLNDQLFRWGAMGHDGAQSVDATAQPFGPVGQTYPFAPGAFLNLDGDGVIKANVAFEGAHGDICHPEIAWAALAAAGLVDPV